MAYGRRRRRGLAAGLALMGGLAFVASPALTQTAAPSSAPAPASSARGNLAIADSGVFPESITSTADGAIYIASFGKGAVYRAAPGASRAEPWLAAGVAGKSLLGVLADDKRQLLWVCASGGNDSPTVVKTFDLASKAQRGSYGFEGGGGCNDMAIAADGTVYGSDFDKGRLMRLKPGDSMFRPWALNPAFKTADGVAVLADGAVYLNTFQENGLWRIPVQADGSAGTPVALQTNRPLKLPDGMRAVNGGKNLLLVEGEGRLSEVTIAGSKATLRTLREGIPDSAAAVTLVGNTAFLVQAKFNRMQDPKSAEPFVALAIPYTPSR